MQTIREISNPGIDRLVNELSARHKIQTNLIIYCLYDPRLNAFLSDAWVRHPNSQSDRLIEEIRLSRQPKLISDQKRSQNDATTGSASLSTYFTKANFAASQIVAKEKALVEQHEISSDTGWFLTLPIPADFPPVELVWFPVYPDKETGLKVQQLIEDKIVTLPGAN